MVDKLKSSFPFYSAEKIMTGMMDDTSIIIRESKYSNTSVPAPSFETSDSVRTNIGME